MAETNVAESQTSNKNEDPSTDDFFSLPPDPENTDTASQEPYVLMETVSLETSADSAALNVHFKVAQDEGSAASSAKDQTPDGSGPATEGNVSNVSTKEESAMSHPIPAPLSLSQYFDIPEPAQDTMGHNFFDSLSAGLSPMMKSVTDITELDTSVEVATEATTSEMPLSSEGEISQSDTSTDLQNLAESTSVATSPSTNKMEDMSASSTEQPQGLLSNLFSEDKSGSDLLGKAFFDSLSQLTALEQPSVESNSPLLGNGPQSLDMYYLDPEEKDQFCDAWIPPKKTKDVLVAMATSSQGSFFPEKNDLTMPGLIIIDQMVDSVKSLMTDLNMENSQSRSCLTVDHVTQDEAGLRQLIKARCYSAAVNLTGRLLAAMGQGSGAVGHPSRHSPYSLQLWYTRIALFVKTRRFQFAELESQAFGDLDKPDIFYQFYPDVFTGRNGSMASFCFRLLLAECPQFVGNYCKALDKLYNLLAIVQKILENLENGLAEDGENKELSEQHREASAKLWKSRECRVLFSILNCMTAQKDYTMAIQVIELLQQKLPSKSTEIQAALGKIYLQLGDVNAAMACFNQVSLARSQVAPSVKYAVEDLMHKALICIVQNNYGDACKHFNQALTLDPGNPVLLNNTAVCLLYVGRLKEAIGLAESVVLPKGDTQVAPSTPSAVKALHEGLLSNTCILYELESSQCDLKKREVLQVVANNVGDSFLVSCLKIDVKAGK